MFYVYVLKSEKDKKSYIGLTNDLRKRVKDHNGERVASTRTRVPLKLLFYEAFISKKDAVIQEKFYKTGHGREVLKHKLKFSKNLI